MTPEHQARFRRVHGNFTFFLCRIAFLLIMVLGLAHGDALAGQPVAEVAQPSVQLSISTIATRSGYSTTYQLSAGWNLISINLNLDDDSRALLRDKGAMALDESNKAYTVSGDLAVSQACWIFCQTAEMLTLFGALPENFDFIASLQPGWNFVGPLRERFLSGDGIFAWDWDGKRFCVTDSLLAGHGYWIYMSDGYVAPPAEDTYLVIDLSEGPSARTYPITCLSTPPVGGWTEEYKTTKLVLRKIPAGAFMMGSPQDELGREDDETQHHVTLTKDFYAGVFEVTQKQWHLVMGNWPSWFENESCRDSRPVEQVSYEDIRGSTTGLGWPFNNNVDAGSFLGRLRARTGLEFDLPTEAQWEYACRAGTTTALNSGKNLTAKEECPNMDEVGQYRYNGAHNDGSDDIYWPADGDTSGGTNTVGSYKPNQWGLYDMHGNVQEWCLDRWNGNAYSPKAVIDPKGDERSSYRAIRSGTWAYKAHDCRSAYRDFAWPSAQYNDVGFRLATPPAEDTYLVIDLSAGANADNYPITYRAAPPDGGWTEAYKTTKLVLRKIPAGALTMGSPEDEPGRGVDETQHQVTLTKGFYMGVFEVTQKQWNLVMGNWPSSFANESCRNSRPVESVSYDAIRGNNTGSYWPDNNDVDADSFLGRLQARTGLRLDLPTEAQWEYACRAKTTTGLNSGTDVTGEEECPNMAEVGRYKHNGGADGSGDGGPAKVGSYKPNQWGLYDMHGNVSEWCLDWWDGSDYSAQAVTNPAGDAGEMRVFRSGSWFNSAKDCRSACRSGSQPSGFSTYVGLRLAAQPEPEPKPQDTYFVIDLSAGASAASYPVTGLSAPPANGWTDEYKTTKLVLRKIPAGAFTMGSPEAELGRYDDETQHQVTLTKDFYAGVFEVTQKQWSLVMGEDSWPSYFTNPSCRDSRPVEQVSYDNIRGSDTGSGWPANSDVDANSFLGLLREKTGLDFDLPTEAQWEYACRARTTTALNSGNNLTNAVTCPNMAEVGRYKHNGGSDDSMDVDTSGGTTKVGSYKPNRWGLYDMHGNVVEWCLDWRQSDLGGSAQTDPPGAAEGAQRTNRGGGWGHDAANCRSAYRDSIVPSNQYKDVGFRLFARSPEVSYLVIDLSAGPNANSYPISYRFTAPAGGWTEEYKTKKLVLRKIPAGTFIMGSPEDELGRYDDETQHQVTLTKDFYAGVFEVTQEQWSLVTSYWPSYFRHVPSRYSRPVEKVSYHDIRGGNVGAGWPDNNDVDAYSFLGKLRARTGLAFDLPTEAQWEYACRAGTETALNSGKDLTDTEECPNMAEVGRYWRNGGEGRTQYGDETVGPAIVGSYKPNQWGLYDMHGNIAELCLDRWDGNDYSPEAVTDPTGAAYEESRIVRGGSWGHYNARDCRSAYRENSPPSDKYWYQGFRLVITAP